MHQTLIKTISIEGGGMLSKPVLRASSKLLMPGFLSSYFFMRAILIIYVGEGYYSSLNLADFDIPTKYEELEYTIRISRIMLQVKVSGIPKSLIIPRVFNTALHLHALFFAEIVINYYFSV
jgi:hypothetical protein